MLPVGAVNDIVNTHNQIVNAGKPVAYNMNIKLHANKNYNGKLNATNAKKYNIIFNPKNGKLTVDKNGKFNYTPNKNFIGTDTFKYNANNGTSNSNTATVTITVTNIPPVANNMNVSTFGNTLYSGKFNVRDLDQDPLRYDCLILPAHGL